MSNRSKAILLDGSMGQEIVNRGGKGAYGEWAVAALHENPQMVKDIHTDYINAGADVITTNTYSTTRTRLRHVGLESRFEALVKVAGQLAVDAKRETGADYIQIAASLSPLEASYINEFQLSFDEMVSEYQEIMRLLAPYVDLYLGETLSTSLEARAFLTASATQDKPIWLSWTLQDHGKTMLRGGETLAEAMKTISEFSMDGIMVNCCTPDSIEAALPLLKSSGMAFGAYANGFYEVPTTWVSDGDVDQIVTRADLPPAVYADHVTQWLDFGATIVGGCCDIGPQHIAKLREMLDQRS